jgi:hypothetical protein
MFKFKKIFFIEINLFFVLILFTFNLSLAQNNCINYVGGIGEAEILFTDFGNKKIVKNYNYKNHNARYLPYRWEFPVEWYPPSSIKIYYYIDIDRNIKASGNGSLKINIRKDAGVTSSIPAIIHRQYLRNGIDINLPDMNTTTRNYYPLPGDELNIKFLLRVDDLDNFRVRFKTRFFPSSGPEIVLIDTIVATTTTANSFRLYNFNTSLPSNINAENFREIRYEWNLEFYPSSTASSHITMYLDKFEVYAMRNNDCVRFPSKKISSLNFFDVYSNSYRDFIYTFLNGIKLQVGVGDHAIFLKGNFMDVDYIPYTSLTTLHRYYKPGYIGRYAPPNTRRELSFYFDEYTVPSTTNIFYDSSSTYYRFHPNARYPDNMMLNPTTTNRYWKIEYDVPYGIMITDLNKNTTLDYYAKTIFNAIKNFHSNSFLSPLKLFFLDNINSHTSISGLEKALRLKNQYKSVILYKFIGNLGYSPSGPGSILRKLSSGYMDEGWFINPDSDNLSYIRNNTSTFYQTVNGFISSNNLDYILVIIGYPPNNFNCTSTDQQLVKKIISAMYAVNNPNIYFALLKGGSNKSYATPQCFVDSMYLPLGQPVPRVITNINQIIYSSSTLDGGIVVLRRYEKGLAVFNSSASSSFNYILSTTTEPFTFYKDAFGNIYDFSQNNIIINLEPRSGIVLYNDQEPTNNIGNIITE